MDFLAMYLPQFHIIPENNHAWGKGFTEWVNVKKAKKYYDWQNQPRVPLNNNYYDLLNPVVIQNQTKLSMEYGIDGFVIYHYWFNGRMVLEKPVEIWRSMKEINQRFCFCWANESWTKTWHGAGGDKEILIQQTYGGRDEWKAHYCYFRKYFQDDRYIKRSNKPIVVIYKIRNIPEFNQMIQYWNKCAKKDGFDGVYVIAMSTVRDHSYMSKWVDATVDFEPNRTKYEMLSMETPEANIIDYDQIYSSMLDRRHDKHQYRTVFVDYDDTPRRGRDGVLCKNVSIDKFENYLRETVKKSVGEKNSYVFINAWNEWGEGNYLEPDETNEFAYLERVLRIKEECKSGLYEGCS